MSGKLPGVGKAGPDGMQLALGQAVAEHGPVALQPGLFGAGEAPAPVAKRAESLPAEKKAGRPPGARNRRTEEYARFLIARHGDPLDVATAIAARDIVAPGELARLADDLGMERKDAAEFWLRTLNAALPFLHQKMPQAVWINPGAPGGERAEIIDADDWARVPPGVSDVDAEAA